MGKKGLSKQDQPRAIRQVKGQLPLFGGKKGSIPTDNRYVEQKGSFTSWRMSFPAKRPSATLPSPAARRRSRRAAMVCKLQR